MEHKAYTVFKKGVYPTRADAEFAIRSGTMYVYEEKGNIAGSIIIDNILPKEYESIPWKGDFTKSEVLVIHLLLVRPSLSGKGIGSSLISYAAKSAHKKKCKALLLDTGSQNSPALSLYKKNGFEVIASAPKKVGNVIAHMDHLYLERIL